MKFRVDMNLTHRWEGWLESRGHVGIHWSHVGDPDADDQILLDWAKANRAITLTLDHDFGRLLAMTKASGPSVILLRCNDASPERVGDSRLEIAGRYSAELNAGALVVFDDFRARVRLLPLP